jgi:hypothetical protein
MFTFSPASNKRNTMRTLIPFFSCSYRIINRWKITKPWAGPRNFQSFTFGIAGDRPYCIIRDRTIETSQYFLLFNDDDFISVNVCFPTPESFKFDADCDLNISKEEACEALFQLFEFVVWDAFHKGIRVIFGRFSYNAGMGHTNEPILKALTALGFVVNDLLPKDPLYTRWLQPGHSAIEQAFLQSGCTDKRFTLSYGRMAGGNYFFVTRRPLQQPNTFVYKLQSAPDQYCQLQGSIQQHTLTLTCPLINSVHVVLFPLLLQQIIFNAIHNTFPRTIVSIRLLLNHDMATWLEPTLCNMDFMKSNTARLCIFWRPV